MSVVMDGGVSVLQAVLLIYTVKFGDAHTETSFNKVFDGRAKFNNLSNEKKRTMTFVRPIYVKTEERKIGFAL
jgi:hypothetical protein